MIDLNNKTDCSVDLWLPGIIVIFFEIVKKFRKINFQIIHLSYLLAFLCFRLMYSCVFCHFFHLMICVSWEAQVIIGMKLYEIQFCGDIFCCGIFLLGLLLTGSLFLIWKS